MAGVDGAATREGCAMSVGLASRAAAEAPLRIGISTCLLGEPVRFDGGHKRDTFLLNTLGPHVEWIPVCPEVEIGLGVPRETIRLVRAESSQGGVRLVTVKSGIDLSERMRSWAARRLDELAHERLSGYVLKKDSPSCGMERVRVYGGPSGATRDGRGLFAEALLARFPELPVEEEGRLSDPRLRENFIERIFAYRRLHTLFSGRWTLGGLVAFHTAHKLAVMAHSPRAYQTLGRLVAHAATMERAEVAREYRAQFMHALAVPATPVRHVNVLQHITGYFKRQLDTAAKEELLTVIDDYRRGLVPLIVPITLVRHYVNRLGVSYLKGQSYLDPHPKELALRNHV